MAGPAFDVYVTGARESSPSGQMRIIAAVAARCRLPATMVAAALDGEGPCRVAERLPRGEAEALAATLEMLGVRARLNPAGAAWAGTTALPAPALTPTASDPPARKDGRVTLKSADTQATVVDLSEPIEFAEAGPEGKTGVRGFDTTRCPVHGLVYNRRQASGCVRCLAPARARARQLEGDTPADDDRQPPTRRSRVGSRTGSWRADPVRRAFLGLAVALAVGFIPAAYHARSSARREVGALRAQQLEIAATTPVTKAALNRFDDLDAEVRAAHLRSAGRTLLLWLVVSSAAGVAWTRLSGAGGLGRPR
ncbi:MAG: hypothetical protein ABUS79_05205 [Pseudomonadota bacterium]